MKTTNLYGERYVSFEAYKKTTTSLKRQLAQAQLELERAQNKSRNLRKAIHGLNIAVDRLKSGIYNQVIAKAITLATSRPALLVDDSQQFDKRYGNVA